MTMFPMYKKCPVCKKMYSQNPSTGKLWCPNCGLFSAMPEEVEKLSALKRKKAFDKNKK